MDARIEEEELGVCPICECPDGAHSFACPNAIVDDEAPNGSNE